MLAVFVMMCVCVCVCVCCMCELASCRPGRGKKEGAKDKQKGHSAIQQSGELYAASLVPKQAATSTP